MVKEQEQNQMSGLASQNNDNNRANGQRHLEDLKSKSHVLTTSPHTLNYLRQQQRTIQSAPSFEMDLFPFPRKNIDSSLLAGDVISPNFGIALRNPGTVNRRMSRTMYELSEDMKANLLGFTEQCYGGRERSHEAAKIIQRAYRQHRLRKNFVNLRRQWMTLKHSEVPSTPAIACVQSIRESLTPKPALMNSKMVVNEVGSLEDLHGSEAYLKWQKSSKELEDETSSVSSSSKSSSVQLQSKDSDSDTKSSQRDSGLIDNNASGNSLTSSSPNTSFNSVSNDSFSPPVTTNFSYTTQSPTRNVHRVLNQQSPSKKSCLQCKTEISQPPGYVIYNNGSVSNRRSSDAQQQFFLLPSNQQNLVVAQRPSPQVLMVSDNGSPIYVLPAGATILTSPSKSNNQPAQIEMNKALQDNLNKQRKRLYRIGLNIFNKNPIKGIDFLVRNSFMDYSPVIIAKFLYTRRGLSRSAIGDYLGNTKNEIATQTTKYFMKNIDLSDLEIDEALRTVMSHFRTPGEAQKIQHLMTEFQNAYVEQNESRVKSLFKSADTVMVLAYAIVMLHTDLHSSQIRPSSKMKRTEFIKNLRNIDAGEDLNQEMLTAIYDRIQATEMVVQHDHTDFVRKIEQSLTGPLRPPALTIPQRRLVCYCRLYEVPDRTKRERIGTHERDVFLFNDMLLITKASTGKQKRSVSSNGSSKPGQDNSVTNSSTYQVKACINLLGIRISTWENLNYPYGIEIMKGTNFVDSSQPNIKNSQNPDLLLSLNTKTSADRKSFFADLMECIQEVNEMDRIRIEEELSKNTASSPNGGHKPTLFNSSTSNSPIKMTNQPVYLAANGQSIQFVRHLSNGTIPIISPTGHPCVRKNTIAQVPSQPIMCSHCNGHQEVQSAVIVDNMRGSHPDNQSGLLRQNISPKTSNTVIVDPATMGLITRSNYQAPGKFILTQNCSTNVPMMFVVGSNTPVSKMSQKPV